MSFLKPDPPTPPNPIETARASTSTNVATGVANAFLNNVNQVTPQGSLAYNATGNYGWNDPVTGQTYNIPTFTATQTLSPQQQAILGQNEAAQYNLAGMANAQSGRISGLLSQPFNSNYNPNTGQYAPAAGDPNSITNIPTAATSFNAGGPIQTQLGDAGDITRTYGPADNFSADRQRVEESLMGRINPQLDIQKQQLQQQLADQGIRYGSDAYNNAFMPYNQQANDARFAAISQAGQEQQRMTQEAGALAAFQNQAQGQAYDQMLGRGTFANAAQGQQFTQNAALGQFANAGLAQQLAQAQSGFNASQAARNAFMNEQYAQRNQPINEITSLMSGSQVTNPNFVNTPGSQIPTTDVGGLINNNFNQQMGIYNAQNQNYQSTIGGLLGLGAGALRGGVVSDRREKDVGDRIGTVFAADSGGEAKKLPIYQYSYKRDPASISHIGPMAQDVEKITPEAVGEVRGVKYIDPDKVMGSILRAS